MAAVSLTPEDLAPFAQIDQAKAEAMIADVTARAARVAPCILTADFAHADAAKAVLRGVVLRWHESGSGALTSESIGEYSYTTDSRQTSRRSLFWPAEVEELQRLCKEDVTSGAFGIDTLAVDGIVQHADICALRFGGLYCSCGAVLTMNLPLYEQSW